MEKEIKTSEALITEINFQARHYETHRNKGYSSDYYKDNTYYRYRHGIYSEYRPARLTLSLKIDDEVIEYDISDEIRDRCGGALKKNLVDSLYVTLPDKVILSEFNEIPDEFYSQWIKEAREFRRAI